MQEFLHKLAEKIYQEHTLLHNVTVVFPNRRAILYFRKHLTSLLERPSFAPTLLTIEEFIAQFSEAEIPDKLVLQKKLYNVYNGCMGQHDQGYQRQSFSDFFFWGEMLLRDFEEIDKYMVEASQLFVDLSNIKEIETVFEFLSEDQITFLKEFWGNFEEHPSVNKVQFLKIWRTLHDVYLTFQSVLKQEGLAYTGMQHRLVAEALMRQEELPTLQVYKDRSIVFAGFNALTLAEEKVLSYFVDNFNAKVVWDTDSYYVNNPIQEAGVFFREYQKHSVLGKTFAEGIDSFLQSRIERGDPINVIGAAQPIGQVKALAQILDENLKKGWKPEETLIVLPDEKLLLPVLHSIPNDIHKLNVTMGFSLASSPLYNFVELLFQVQLTAVPEGFYHRPVLALLDHPYILAFTHDQTNAIKKNILSKNWVHIPLDYFRNHSSILRDIFRYVEANQLLSYFQNCIKALGESPKLDAMDKEYAFHFFTFLNRLEDIVAEELKQQQENRKKQIKSFQRLFQQLLRAEKIPFAGEPLEGLQIMGVLETRNLDFKNILILSLNEGAIPAGGSRGSYIPYNLRKAYGLPTSQHQDAMYAYLFYRILQRADTVHLFYNTEADSLGQGEMSRYLQQLIFESGLTIYENVLHNTIQPKLVEPIVIEKNEDILKTLNLLSKGRGLSNGISPSALSMYMECRLKFYFRYVVGIREADEIEEDIDNRIVGIFLHTVMEHFYKNIQSSKRSAKIEAKDLDQYGEMLNGLIDSVFRDSFGLSKTEKVDYKGQRLIVKEIVMRLAEQIIQLDKEYAPFELLALEREGLTVELPISFPPHRITLSGTIDRIDKKDEVIRIVDYKTGKDELNFTSLESLFERDGKRNKAAFQTLLYALLFSNESANTPSTHLVPGLINRKNLFDSSFQFGLKLGKEYVKDTKPLLPDFKRLLQDMLDELYNPATAFDQTTNLDVCKHCEFKTICARK